MNISTVRIGSNLRVKVTKFITNIHVHWK